MGQAGFAGFGKGARLISGYSYAEIEQLPLLNLESGTLPQFGLGDRGTDIINSTCQLNRCMQTLFQFPLVAHLIALIC